MHVDNARRMVAMHTAGRKPPGSLSGVPGSAGLGSTVPAPARTPPSPSSVRVPAASHSGECHNPQCGHCGTVIIPLPKATFPLLQKPSISVNQWSIYTEKGPICALSELDHLNELRFDFPLPEMIFGSNLVRIVHDPTGDSVEFNTLDALDLLENDSDFKVAYHKEWLLTRPKAELTVAHNKANPSEMESVKPYDWTYSTNYKGSVRTKSAQFVATQNRIPTDRLLQPDPILFYDEAILFEDELGDNGILMLLTKIRVMPSCMLLLCRFFLRVDDVVFRIRDTRLFVDFDSNQVLREYKVQQADYADLAAKVPGRSNDPKKCLRDVAWVALKLPLVAVETEELTPAPQLER